MSKLFFMQKVKSLAAFEKSVSAMARQKNAKLFHCYVCGNIFKITTVDILRENLPQQILLFDEVCNPELFPNKLS